MRNRGAHLGGHEPRRAEASLDAAGARVLASEAKVDELEARRPLRLAAARLKHDVLRLDVPVHHAARVHVLHRGQELREELRRLGLREALCVEEAFGEAAATQEL